MEKLSKSKIHWDLCEKYKLDSDLNIGDFDTFIDVCLTYNIEILKLRLSNYERSPESFSINFSSLEEYKNYDWGTANAVEIFSVSGKYSDKDINFSLDVSSGTVSVIQDEEQPLNYEPLIQYFELLCKKKINKR